MPAADRYLKLLARQLTRYGLDDGHEAFRPESARAQQMWEPVERALHRRRISVRRTPDGDPRSLRADGRDWPRTAETMIGLARLENLRASIRRIIDDDVPGDLLEAGVWRGGASIYMRAALEAYGDDRRAVWLADSFRGLPKPRPQHAADAQDLHWAQTALMVPLEEVKANFERYDLLDERVRFLVGWFADTLPAAPVDALSLLRADGDMYGSTMDILGSLYDRVSVGGFVVIDDYGAIPGCKIATDEFRSARGIEEPLERIDWTGVYWRRVR